MKGLVRSASAATARVRTATPRLNFIVAVVVSKRKEKMTSLAIFCVGKLLSEYINADCEIDDRCE